MTIDAYQRVHAAVRRRWGSHQDARDAASEAYARWLANPADKTAHDVRSHVRYMVMHAGQILSPTGRRAAGRLMRPLAGRFGLGVDAGGANLGSVRAAFARLHAAQFAAAAV